MLYDLSHVDYQKPNLQTMVSDSWFSEVEGAGGGGLNEGGQKVHTSIYKIRKYRDADHS